MPHVRVVDRNELGVHFRQLRRLGLGLFPQKVERNALESVVRLLAATWVYRPCPSTVVKMVVMVMATAGTVPLPMVHVPQAGRIGTGADRCRCRVAAAAASIGPTIAGFVMPVVMLLPSRVRRERGHVRARHQIARGEGERVERDVRIGQSAPRLMANGARVRCHLDHLHEVAILLLEARTIRGRIRRTGMALKHPHHALGLRDGATQQRGSVPMPPRCHRYAVLLVAPRHTAQRIVRHLLRAHQHRRVRPADAVVAVDGRNPVTGRLHIAQPQPQPVAHLRSFSRSTSFTCTRGSVSVPSSDTSSSSLLLLLSPIPPPPPPELPPPLGPPTPSSAPLPYASSYSTAPGSMYLRLVAPAFCLNPAFIAVRRSVFFAKSFNVAFFSFTLWPGPSSPGWASPCVANAKCPNSSSGYARSSPIIFSSCSSTGYWSFGFWIGGMRFASRATASSVSMCIWIVPGTIWCRLRTCSAVTLPSVQTRSMNLHTIFVTALPVSPGSCSSNPSSLLWSLLWLRDSITLFDTLVSSSRCRPSLSRCTRPTAPPTSCGTSRYTIRSFCVTASIVAHLPIWSAAISSADGS
uniref:Uncharacterized protein n=1 Tax=Anopheles melas TaxID=34690 RepID=A0A182UCA2_9DIPT